MGLRDEAQEELREAFDVDLADVITNFKLVKSPTVGEYDPDTGTRPTTPQEFKSRGLFSAMPTRKVNGTSILSTDEELIIIADEIEQPPKVDDKIVTNGGLKYLVVAPNPVMGGDSIPIIYEAQVRKNG
jgi:hypothetical protein